MNGSLEEFLAGRLPFPGLAAWSARLSDHTTTSHCYSDWFAAQQAEQTLGRLALAADSLGNHRIQPVRLSWVFEHARIYLGLRRDGACLALFVENRPDLSPTAAENVLDEFAQLPA